MRPKIVQTRGASGGRTRVDLAELGLKIDSSGAVQATTALDKLVGSAQGAEKAVSSLGGTSAAVRGETTRGAQAIVSTSQSLARMAEQAALSNTQMMALTAVARHTFDAIIAGRPPVQALMMEFGNLSYALSGSGGLIGSLGRIGGVVKEAISPMVAIGVAAAATVATALVAVAQYEAGQRELQQSLNGLGRASGATADQMEAIAEATASAAHVSIGAARDIEAAFAQTGKVGVDQFGTLIKFTKEYAVATGETVPKATKELAKALSDPAKGMDVLSERLGFLNDATKENIDNLIKQGDAEKAAKALIDAMVPSVKQATDTTSGFAHAWEAVKENVSAAFNAIGNAIAGPDLAQKITSLKQTISDIETGKQKFGGRGNLSTDLSGLRAQLDLLEQQAQAEKKIADQRKLDVQANQLSLVAGPVIRSSTPGFDDERTLRNNIALLRQLTDGSALGNAALSKLNETRQQATDALDANTRALATYLTPAEKARQLDLLDIQAQRAIAPAQKAAIAAERERIAIAGQVITTSEAQKDIDSARAKALADATHGIDEQSRALTANARASIDVATAYLQNSAAGEKAQAMRQALSESVRNGVDVEMRARQILQEQVAQQAADAAKAAAGTELQAQAQSKVNTSVEAGTVSVQQASRALQVEAAIRPLVIALANAESGARDALTAAIQRTKGALASLFAAQDQSVHDQTIDRLTRETAQQNALADAYRNSPAAVTATETAIRVQNDALSEGIVLTLKQAAGIDQVNEKDRDRVTALQNKERAQTNANIAEAAAQKLEGDQNTSAQLRLQIGLIGQSSVAQQKALAILQREQELRRGLNDQERKAIEDHVDLTAQLTREQAAYDEIKSFATDTFSTIGDAIVRAFATGQASAIKFGDILKSVAASAISLFLRLAAINPLQNSLFGLNPGLPTLSDVSGVLGGLGGGPTATGGGLAGSIFSIGKGLSGGFSQNAFGGIANFANRGVDALFGTNFAPSLSQQFEGAIPANGFLNLGGIGNGLLAGGADLIGSLISGKGIGKSLVSAGFTAAGSAIGGPIGGVIGHVIGSLISSLFGKKKPPFIHLQLLTAAQDAASNLFKEGVSAPSPFGTVGFNATSKHTPEGLEQQIVPLLAQMDQAFASNLSTGQIGTVSSALQNATPFRSKSRGEVSGEVFDIIKDRIETILNAVVPPTTTSKALDSITRSNENLQQLVDAANNVLSTRKQIQDTIDSLTAPKDVSEVVQGLKSINDQFDQMKAKAPEVGIALADVEKARQIAITNLKNGFVSGIQDQYAQLTNPQAFDTSAVNKAAQKAIDDAKALGVYDQVKTQIEAIRQAGLAEVLAKYAQTADQAATSTDGLQKSLTDAFGKAQDYFVSILDPLQKLRTDLSFGGSSVMSPAAQLAAVKAEYGRTYGLARAGDEAAIRALPNLATSYISAQRAYDPGQAFNQTVTQVQRDNMALINQIQTIQTNFMKSVGAQNVVAIQQRNTTNGFLAEIRQELATIKNQLAQQAANPRKTGS